MNPRGVTLVEILAAVSIMVVVTALSLPAVQGRLAGARMEAAQGILESAVIATRAEAVKRGKALELFVHASKDGAEVLVRELEDGEPVEGEERVARENGNNPKPMRPTSLWGVLPAGLEVAAEPRNVEREESGRGQKPGDVRIAVFCPDGTAVGGKACFLRDGKDEFSIAVNGWVGGVSFSRYIPPADGEEERPETLTEEKSP